MPFDFGGVVVMISRPKLVTGSCALIKTKENIVCVKIYVKFDFGGCGPSK